MDRKILLPLVFEVALKHGPSPWGSAAYRKILVPLDGSEEAEQALGLAQELVPPGTEGILLQVIPPGKAKGLDANLLPSCKDEEARRSRARGYLRCAVQYIAEAPGRWRCEVAVSSSVVDAIANFAIQENVDLIAMYTRDRKGLAKLVRESVAEKVQRAAPAEVRVLRTRELAVR